MRLVVKIGGSLISEGLPNKLLSEIAFLHNNHQLIIVHGGGNTVNLMMKRLGREPKFITSASGIRSRYTDKETADIYTMVMSGLIAPQLALELSKLGAKAFSLAGYDAGLVRAERKKRLIIINGRGRKMVIEGGYTGKISMVDKSLLEDLVHMDVIPIISPVAISHDYELLNVDSDRVASSVASSIGADRLILLSNIDGLFLNGNIVRELTSTDAKRVLPYVGSGMDKKIMAAIEAVEKGVQKAVISSGKNTDAIQKAMSETSGTVITRG